MKPLLYFLVAFEGRIIEFILRRPGFHRFVGRIQRQVDEAKYGRDPNDPLRPGEATEHPEKPSFWRHFVGELKNQLKGTPQQYPPSSSTKVKR